MAALGIVLLTVGGWFLLTVGPSGTAHFSATSKGPGAIVIPANVLNAVDVPVRITAARRDGGAVFLAAAPSADARAILARSAVSTVKAVHYPAGSIELRASGAGALTDLTTSDVWRLATKGARSAEMVVEQGDDQSRVPETAVVASGDATALRDVTVTMTWVDRTWFFEALAAAMIGALIATFALGDLWQVRAKTPRVDVVPTAVPEAVK
ncbi:MAG: hypothetical protein QOE58_2349 [Actinomycetota bacterium]|jgi:hypothetical protein|nr:hypothetical protein [Actinomycetota bacterium]